MSRDTQIPRVRLPDEVLHLLGGIADRFPRIAKLDAKTQSITLHRLTIQEKIALRFMDIVSELEGIFDNIGMSINDLERMKRDPHWHGSGSPIDRFKMCMRMCYYEYGRFEDLFALYTLWLCHMGFITKAGRKVLLNDFHEQNKPIIRSRNVLLHDSTSWKGWHTTEITLLQGGDLVQGKMVHKKTGTTLQWSDHIAPMCEDAVKIWLDRSKNMVTCWNMLFADAVRMFVESGKLRKSKKRYRGKDSIQVMRAAGEIQSGDDASGAELQELTRRMHTINVLLAEVAEHPVMKKQQGMNSD
jgi:hypothetical protein